MYVVSQRNYWRCFEEVITWIPKMWRTTWKLDASDFWNNDDLIHTYTRTCAPCSSFVWTRSNSITNTRWVGTIDVDFDLSTLHRGAVSSWTSSSESKSKCKSVLRFLPEAILLIYGFIRGLRLYEPIDRYFENHVRGNARPVSLFTLRSVIPWST